MLRSVVDKQVCVIYTGVVRSSASIHTNVWVSVATIFYSDEHCGEAVTVTNVKINNISRGLVHADLNVNRCVSVPAAYWQGLCCCLGEITCYLNDGAGCEVVLSTETMYETFSNA